MKSESFSECLWNSMTLQPPHIQFLEAPTLLSTKKRTLREAIKNEYSCNKYRDLLFLEMVTLSRFLEERKRKYRNDKGFTTVCRINKVVNRIHYVDLKTAASVMKLNLTDSFVPSKQLCQWLLVKLQSNVMLLRRLIELCQYSAKRLYHRLKTGHNWIEVTIVLSMISRIWSLGNFLIKNSFKSYQKLFSILDDLPFDPKERLWSKLTCHFPDDLEFWISESECCRPLTEMIEIKENIRFRVTETSGMKNIPNSSKENIEVPNTKDNQVANTKKQKIKWKMKLSKLISNINTHEDLKLFLRQEERFRSDEMKHQNCISKNMDALQWHMFSRRVCQWLKKLKVDKTGKLIPLVQVKLRRWLLAS